MLEGWRSVKYEEEYKSLRGAIQAARDGRAQPVCLVTVGMRWVLPINQVT